MSFDEYGIRDVTELIILQFRTNSSGGKCSDDHPVFLVLHSLLCVHGWTTKNFNIVIYIDIYLSF